MTSDQTRPKLTYFNWKGRGQPIRWALSILGIDFIDNIVSYEWYQNELAAKSPNGLLPIFEHKGEIYTDSLCILRYISAYMVPENRTLMPDTDLDDLHAVVAFCLVDTIATTAIQKAKNTKESEKAKLKDTAPETFSKLFKALDNHIATRQDSFGHIVSHKLTYADLYVAGIILEGLSHRLGLAMPELDKYIPHALLTTRMVLSHPAVRKFEYEFDFKSPTLSYFNLPARGEAIRLCLSLGNVKFEDKLYDFATWGTVTTKVTPTGQLPMIEFEDKFFVVETEAILNWAGEKCSLMPRTLPGKARADMLYSRFQPVTYLYRSIKESSDPEGRRKAVIEEELPKELTVMNKLIIPTATWCADVKVTWIDIYLATQWKTLVQRELLSNEKGATDFPQLYRIYKQVYDLPDVKKYFESKGGAC